MIISSATVASGIWSVNMPITAIIRLRAQTAGKASRSFHCLMHPVLLDRIQHVSPAMSAELHDSLAMSPFSLSPVMGLHKQRMIRANQTCWVRVGILTDALQECFVNTLEQGVSRYSSKSRHFRSKRFSGANRRGKRGAATIRSRRCATERIRLSASPSRFTPR